MLGSYGKLGKYCCCISSVKNSQNNIRHSWSLSIVFCAHHHHHGLLVIIAKSITYKVKLISPYPREEVVDIIIQKMATCYKSSFLYSFCDSAFIIQYWWNWKLYRTTHEKRFLQKGKVVYKKRRYKVMIL